jgi:hypothetical protein
MWGMLALVIVFRSYKVQLGDRVLQAGLLFVIGIGTYLSYSGYVFRLARSVPDPG